MQFKFYEVYYIMSLIFLPALVEGALTIMEFKVLMKICNEVGIGGFSEMIEVFSIRTNSITAPLAGNPLTIPFVGWLELFQQNKLLHTTEVEQYKELIRAANSNDPSLGCYTVISPLYDPQRFADEPPLTEDEILRNKLRVRYEDTCLSKATITEFAKMPEPESTQSYEEFCKKAGFDICDVEKIAADIPSICGHSDRKRPACQFADCVTGKLAVGKEYCERFCIETYGRWGNKDPSRRDLLDQDIFSIYTQDEVTNGCHSDLCRSTIFDPDECSSFCKNGKTDYYCRDLYFEFKTNAQNFKTEFCENVNCQNHLMRKSACNIEGDS